MLAAIGFDVRVPALSRRKAKPSLRLFAEAVTGSVVGAHQLSNVAWSALFDDVELTAAEVKRLATQARPLVQSRGRWVEVDRVDLEAAAAALAERESITQLSGAEILRHSIGLDGSGWPAASWSTATAGPTTSSSGPARPRSPRTAGRTGFVGTLRSYQAEAVAWIGFLDSAGLGGCLALDMGLGKTPTVLAHLAGAGSRRQGARHRAGRGRRQLGGRSGEVHAASGASSCTTAHRGRRPSELAHAGGRRRHRDHHVRHRRPRHRRPGRDRVAQPRPRRGPGDQEPGERHGTSNCAVSTPTPGWLSPARRSRTASATSGRSSTSPIRGSSEAGRRSSPRCPATARRRCGP